MGRLQTFFGDDADLVYDRRFQVLLLGSIVSPLGSSVISPMLNTLTGVYGVGEARIGLLMAVFTAPPIVLIPLVGALSDRYGRKPVLVTGLVLFGTFGVALTGTTDFRLALLFRFLQGIGYSGVAPVLIASVGDIYAGDREATAQGLRFTVVGFSLTVFPLVAGLVVTLSWQFPFYLFALGLPAGVAVFALFEEPTRRSEAGTDESAPDGGSSVRQILALIRTPRIAATLVGRTVPSFLWFAFLTYNSIVVVRLLDGTPGQAGMLVAIASLSSSVGATQVGRLTAAFETRRYPLLGATVVCTAGLTAVALAPSVVAAGVGALFTGAGFGIVLTLYRSLFSGLAPEHLRGTLVSVSESIGRIGSTSAPVVVGGAVALSQAALGFAAAVRYSLVAVAVGSTLVAVVCIVVADANIATPSDAMV